MESNRIPELVSYHDLLAALNRRACQTVDPADAQYREELIRSLIELRNNLHSQPEPPAPTPAPLKERRMLRAFLDTLRSWWKR